MERVGRGSREFRESQPMSRMRAVYVHAEKVAVQMRALADTLKARYDECCNICADLGAEFWRRSADGSP